MIWEKPLPLYEANVVFFFLFFFASANPGAGVGEYLGLLEKEERRRMKISLHLFTLYFASCVDVYEMIPCTSLHL